MNRSLAALYRVFAVDRLPYNGAVSLVRWRRDAPPVAHLSLGKENRLSPSRRSSYHRRLSSRSSIGSIAVKSKAWTSTTTTVTTTTTKTRTKTTAGATVTTARTRVRTSTRNEARRRNIRTRSEKRRREKKRGGASDEEKKRTCMKTK